MEDLIGIIIFILFIMLRAMGDRKKGMKKQPVRTRRPETPKEPVVLGKERLRPQKPEPVSLGEPEMKRESPGLSMIEGEYTYEGLTYMENQEPGRVITYATEPEAPEADRFSLSSDDLRKAVIWSEILQKPRFKVKPGVLSK